MTHMRPLTPRCFEALPAVSATEMPTSCDHRHVVPTLAVILQVLQVLEAAGAGRAGVESAGRGRRMGFTHVDPEVYLGVKGATADGAGVFGDEVEFATGEAFFQRGKVLLLVDPLDMFLQEIPVGEGDGAVWTREELSGRVLMGENTEGAEH